MPPKIRGMNANMTLAKRFTLMLSGEDVLEPEADRPIRNSPERGLPHERFLLGEKLPAAPILLLGQSNTTIDPNLMIACLQPIHLHATRDHLVLMNQNQVELSNEESAKLLKVALPLIEEDFHNPLLFQGVHDWFIPAGPFVSLASHSIDQAHGRNIDWWMPRDSYEVGVAKAWRKLQNEIQMLWHIDSVNEIREQRGALTINSIWISGIGKLNDVHAPQTVTSVANFFGEHLLLKGLSKFLNIPCQPELASSGLANGFGWFNQPQSIWPILEQALLNKVLDELLIIDFPKGLKRERILLAKDLHKRSWAFWRKAEVLTWKEIAQS